MIPVAPWLRTDAGAPERIVTPSIDPKYAMYGAAIGTGIALVAPTKFKRLGIGLAVISGAFLVLATPISES